MQNNGGASGVVPASAASFHQRYHEAVKSDVAINHLNIKVR
jgi:hypothetical protein